MGQTGQVLTYPEGTMKRVAIYVRVSTDGQTVENQLAELRQHAERAGWQVVAEYRDEGVSGTKGRDKRPALDAALKGAARREFDVLAAWSVDRLGRSLQDLLGSLGELRGVGCDLYLHRQALDTSTPSGNAMFQMLGVFAEFEAAMIRDRVRAGLARAKAAGRVGGGPKAAGRDAVRSALASGASLRQAAAAGGVALATAQRVKAAMRA
jgi:DNA invertase Pin-like site-specific DNA recombinase